MANYVNNPDFLRAMTAYRKDYFEKKDAGLGSPRVPNYIGECIYHIANNLIKKPNFSGYCVDIETEAMTRRGWLKYDEVTLDDEVASYDLKTGHLTWSKIKSIYQGGFEGLMHSFKSNSSFDALVTPNHKFITYNYTSKETKLTYSENLNNNLRIVTLGDHIESGPGTYKDEFIELVGWAVTEGHFSKGKNTHSVAIYQNVGQSADRIRTCLSLLDAKYSENERKGYSPEHSRCVEFNILRDVANQLHEVVDVESGNKILTYEFIHSLTQEQRLLLIRTMVEGDGFINQEEGYLSFGYTQKCEVHYDRFVYLCTLAGFGSSKYLRDCESFGKQTQVFEGTFSNNSRFKQIQFQVLDTNGAVPKRSGNKKETITTQLDPTTPYKGIVWCVETEYGSFMCRRNNKVYLTGNTSQWKDEMIGDAIENCMMYLHNFNPEKSNNPFAYFTRIIWFAFIRRIQKEKKQQYVSAKLTMQNNLHDPYMTNKEDNEVTYERYDQLKKMFEPEKGKKAPSGLEAFTEEKENE